MPVTQRRFTSGRKPEREEEKGFISEFTSGVSAGVDTTMGALGGVGALFNTVTGDEEEAMEYLAYAQRKFQDASESVGSVQTIEEIEGAGDFVRWAMYSAGTLIPTIATSALGGGVGGYLGKKAAETVVKDKIKKEVYDKVQDNVSEAAKNRMYRETLAGAVQPYRKLGQQAGTFVSSAAQNTGSTYLDIYQETGIEAPDVALAAGVASGALDAIVPLRILQRIMPPTVFTKFKDKLSDRIVDNGGVVRRVMKEATKQGLFEGFTEATQELIQATAVGMMRNDPTGGFAEYADEFVRNLENLEADDQLRSRLLNAAAVGAIGGTFTGSVSGAFKGEERRVEDARKVNEPETEQAAKEQQSQDSEEAQIQSIIREFDGRIDRKAARRILVERQTNQETARQELGEEQKTAEQQAPFSPLDQAPEKESLELEATRQRQRIVRERAQGLGGEPRRRGISVDEQRARVYEEQLNESMGRVLRSRRVLNEIVPISLYEGTTTPEENALAAQEAERITVLPSGPTIELGPDRTMESLERQTVDYQGIRGTLTRREDGVFVVVTPQGDEVVVESGESDAGSTAAALLGVRPVDINVDTPAPEIQFNPQDQTFVSRGKKYRYIETRYDNDGQPVAIDAETMEGQPRVFRSQRTLRAMEAEQAKIQQSEMTQNLATGPAQFDDLSEKLQMAVFDQRETQGVDTATDSVTREEIEAAVESAPASIQASLRRETEALFARNTETEFEIRQTFRDEDQWLSFEGDVVNANQETLEARQERLDLLSGQPNKPANSDDLITIKGVEGVAEKVGNAMRRKAFFKLEVDGQETNLEVIPAEKISEIDSSVDSASATNEIQQAVFDLIEAGLPTEFVDDIQSIAVHLAKDMDALGATASDRMSLDSAIVSKSLTDPDADRELRYVMSHEAWHVIDNKSNASGILPSFSVEIIFGAEGPKIVLGDALADLYDNYLQGTELGRRFTYPFNEIEQRLSAEADPAKLESLAESVKNFIKKESFAQLGAVYVSNPRLLKQQAPEAYNVIRTIRDNPKLVTGDEDARVQDTQVGIQPEGAGVQGEVRPPTVSGSNEVEADGGAREAGLDGAEAGQADQVMGGEAQQEAGDGDGPAVQQGLADDTPQQGTLFVRRLEKDPTKQEQSRRDLLKKIATVAVVSGSGVKGTSYFAEIASNPELVRGKAKPISDFVQRPLPEESISALASGDLPKAIDLAVAGAPQDVIDLANKIKATLPAQDLYETDVQRGQWNVAGTVSLRNTPTITIMPDTKDSGMTGTLLHEAMHLGIAARYRSLSTVSSANYELLGMDQPKAREALDQWNKLWSEFRRAVNPNLQRSKVADLPFETQVAYGSPDEFFVRALTQPEFQQQLHEINYEGKTLLERFKDWVKRYLFGPDTGVQPTYLDAAMTAANDLFDAATLDSPDFAFMKGINAELAQERDSTQNELIDVPSQKRGPTGRPYQGLPANETLGGEDRVQTSLPNGKRQGEKFYETGAPEDYSIGIDRILTDTAKNPVKEKLKTTIEGYNFFTPSRSDLTAEETIEEFKTHMVDNLIWLHDQMDPEIRAEAKQWYDGARKQVDLWVDRYGLEPRQVAAVVANLSPQKDWFMNMSLAERMMDIYTYRQDFKADKSMDEAFVRIVLSDEKGKRRLKLNEQQQAQRKIWSQIKDKSLSEVATTLPAEQVDLGQAVWVRMYDEAKHSRKFRVMRPSGEIMGLSMGKDGPKNVAWGSFTEIAKGISVLRNSSLESVSLSLGDAHKVRNFYNNIVAPDSELGEVTIDTHAVAAALFKPLSAKSYEVAHAFGGTPAKKATPQQLGLPDGVARSGAGSSRVIGVGGTYGIVADAYREAAYRLGILPRQLQSITWEEIRVIYPASFKDEKGVNLGKINDLWTRYGNGELSIDEVRDQAYEITGTKGSKPVWAVGSNAQGDGESRTSTYNRELYPDGVSGSGSTGSNVGSGGDVDATAGATAGGLAATVKVGRPNTKVRPEVRRAYEALQSGQITRQEYDEAVLETIRPYEAVPTPATAEEMSSALRGTQVSRVNQPVDNGASVGLRLDINAYEKNDTWVPTIHDARGRPISHMATASVTGADFTDFKQSKAQKVMEGGSKTPFAQIKGAYVGRSDEENVRLAQQYLNDPEWRQVGFDPRRHSTFYDRATGEPIATADEVIQVGPLVLAKNAEILPTEQTLFVKRLSGKTQTYEEAKLSNELEDGSTGSNEYTLDDATRTEALLIQWQDEFLMLKKAEQALVKSMGVKELPEAMSPYPAEALHSGKIKADIDSLRDKYIKPIGDLMREDNISLDEMASYLYAKHAPERNREIAKKNPEITSGSGLTDQQAADHLANTDKVEQKERIAALVYEMLEKNRERMVEFGLIEEETIDDYRAQYNFYVPLKGFAATEEGDAKKVAPPSGLPKGFSIGGKEFMTAWGRQSEADNPLLFAMKDVADKIVRARRLEVTQKLVAMADQVQAMGSDQFTVYRNPSEYPMFRDKGKLTRMDIRHMREAKRDDDPTTRRFLSSKENGKEIFVEIKNAALNSAMHKMGSENYANLSKLAKQGVDSLQWFQNTRRNFLINWNPSWFFINPLRDLQTGIMYALSESSKAGGLIEGENITADILKNWLPAGRAYFKNSRGGSADNEFDDLYKEYIEAGAPTGMTLTRDIDEQKRQLQNIMSEGTFSANVRKLGKLVEDLNTASENMVRFAAFAAARGRGVSTQKAALLAKNLTVNFNRKGEMNSTMNLFYLFFNAAVQGTANIAQAMSGKTADGKYNNAQIAAFGIAGVAALVTQHNLMEAEEDDDGRSLYNDLSDYDKLMSWNIVMPDGKSFLQIPMPYGYGMFHTLGRLSVEWGNGEIDAMDVAAETTAAVAHHFLPPNLGFTGQVLNADDGIDFLQRAAVDISPDFMEPVLAIGFNKTHFGSPIYIPDNPLLPERPDSSRAKRNTEQVYRDTAELINRMTFGTENIKGKVDVSPDVLKYAVEYWAGGVARFFNRSMDVGYKAMDDVNGNEVLLKDYPILRYFAGEPRGFQDKLEYYENIKRLDQILAEEESLGRDDVDDFKRRFGDLAKLGPLYKETQKQLRALRKKKKEIEKLQGDPTRSYEQIQKLEEQMDLLYDKFNKRYREATK